MEIAVEKAKKVRPDIKLGICHKIGLNYVSCIPYRVPIARLAAAQAALDRGVSEAVYQIICKL